MSRLTAIVALFVATVSARVFDSAGVVKNCKRTLHMLEPDVTIYTNDITFAPDASRENDDNEVYFEYIVATDYEETLVDIVIRDATRMDDPLYKEAQEGSQLYNPKITKFEQDDFMWYRFDITDQYREARDGQVHLEVKEYHKRRRIPFPESIPLKAVQTMEFYDSQYLLSPYTVEKQLTLYMLESKRIVMFKESENIKQVQEGIRYGPFKAQKPFTFDLTRLLFEYSDPQLLLIDASKTFTVSHWGNIAVDEHFDLENVGAKLKGEFSRVDYDYYGQGDNCLKSIMAEYPWYIQGMYFNDFIGNISSTNAFRDQEEGRVSLTYRTRFPVCGGWKIDWN
jgi:hypothetical protein